MKDNIIRIGNFSDRTRYVPNARYHVLGDFIEYVRDDKPYIMRRIDSFLTIAIDLETRQPAGFRLKGFKHFYLEHFHVRGSVLGDQFHAIVTAIEVAATKAGQVAFGPNAYSPTWDETKSAYKSAHAIAAEDKVQIEPTELAA